MRDASDEERTDLSENQTTGPFRIRAEVEGRIISDRARQWGRRNRERGRSRKQTATDPERLRGRRWRHTHACINLCERFYDDHAR